jgi:hypothetical protein
MNVGLGVMRRSFRVFVHSPAELLRASEGAGLSLVESGQGGLWAFAALRRTE